MRNFGWTVSLVTAAVLCACSAARLSTEQIYGSWRVAEVLCSGCAGPVLSLKGKLIEIGKEHVVNPVGDDCEGTLNSQFIKQINFRRALMGVGRTWPTAVREALAAKPKILYGFLTCNGVNYMQIALTSPDSAYYFEEDGVTLALARAK
ncbi:MAG TPA: hypothetical protein VKV15_11080 [Bryobacteraceae bacterium]|nr:hypothetical protein [Bryobacteraceae bacterium]